MLSLNNQYGHLAKHEAITATTVRMVGQIRLETGCQLAAFFDDLASY